MASVDDPIQNPPEEISVERLRQILAERDEALKLNEKVSAELAEAKRQKNEISNEFDEMLKERNGFRSEIGNARGSTEEKISEIKNLNEAVAQLVKEKDHIGYLLRTALSKGIISDPSLNPNQLFDAEEHEIFAFAGALDNIVKASQSETIELRHSLEELRAESVVLKENLESQSKELKLRWHQIQQLEAEKRTANESVEGLMMDIAAAEEAIMRWKVAAEQEAAAGKAVEQEFLAQISAVKQELEEARQVMLDSDEKLKFKEETTNAAMAARDAAEKSLRLADVRASRLKERLLDLTRQLEQLDSREDSRKGGLNGHRYVCWPWQWLGLDFVGSCHSETQQESSNKMELSEPLL